MRCEFDMLPLSSGLHFVGGLSVADGADFVATHKDNPERYPARWGRWVAQLQAERAILLTVRLDSENYAWLTERTDLTVQQIEREIASALL
jgi:hypothetical protein